MSNTKIFEPRTKILKNFLNEFEDIVLLKVDKQADLVFMTKTEYNSKSNVSKNLRAMIKLVQKRI
jgi:hypothetical protein